MSSVLPLSQHDTLRPNENSKPTTVTEFESSINSPEQALRLIEAFPPEDGLNSIGRSLDDLETVCEKRVLLLESVRDTLVGVARRICANIDKAGLVAKPLPRGYRVMQHDQSLYLVKECRATGQESPDQEPENLVFTGQDTLYARLTLRAPSLRPCDLSVFCNDLQSGLLEDLTAYVKNSLGQVEVSLQLLNQSHLDQYRSEGKQLAPSEEHPSEKHPSEQIGRRSGRLKLQDLGRSRKATDKRQSHLVPASR